jgi:ribosome-binding factor A
MTLYKIPDLIFAKDESVAYGGKIDELLRNLNQD